MKKEDVLFLLLLIVLIAVLLFPDFIISGFLSSFYRDTNKNAVGVCPFLEICSAGETRCSDNHHLETCGDFDLDGCREWGNSQFCENGCLEEGIPQPICITNPICGDGIMQETNGEECDWGDFGLPGGSNLCSDYSENYIGGTLMCVD